MTAANNQKTMTTKLTVTAMLTAVAVVLQYIEFSIPIVPSFLKLDFSDLPELIGTFRDVKVTSAGNWILKGEILNG